MTPIKDQRSEVNMKPILKIVAGKSTAPTPYDEQKGCKHITALQKNLLSAAVRYVKQGTIGSTNDRIRKASDLSGIPRNLIEVEIKI